MSTDASVNTTAIDRRERNLIIHEPIILIAQQPITELPIAKDLPRLVRKVSMFEGFSTRLNSDSQQVELEDDSALKQVPLESQSNDQSVLVFNLLSVLCERLNGTSFPLYEVYSSQVSLTQPETLNNFLNLFLGEGNILTKILKVIQQNVVLALLVKLKDELKKEQVLCKDVQGAWKIRIHFPTEHSDDELHCHKVCVAHRRAEQVYEKVMDEKSGRTLKNIMLFKFEWELCFYFNTDGSIYDVNARFIKIVAEEETPDVSALSESKKRSVANVFKKINDVDLALTGYDPLTSPSTIIQVTPNTPDQKQEPKRGGIVTSLKQAIRSLTYVSSDTDDLKRSPRSPRSPNGSSRSNSFDVK